MQYFLAVLAKSPFNKSGLSSTWHSRPLPILLNSIYWRPANPPAIIRYSAHMATMEESKSFMSLRSSLGWVTKVDNTSVQKFTQWHRFWTNLFPNTSKKIPNNESSIHQLNVHLRTWFCCVLWFKPSQQPRTTQPFTQTPTSRTGERIRMKAANLVGRAEIETV